MATNPVSTASNYVSQVQPQPQTHSERVSEEKVKEQQRDTTRDDSASAAKAADAALKQTVNSNGQTVGSIINVKA
ncbi:MAG: hypothetical protein HY799_07110 [Nitrosomonadales bacterium]|nr:hypothetical protein [Nitrosomonadales bacterium]